MFGPRHKTIFVHGCFWHQHPGCSANRIPKTRSTFWRDKLLDANVERDRRNEAALRADGWSVLVIWECDVVSDDGIADRIRGFLERGDG